MSKKQRKTFDAILDSDHITLPTTLHDKATVTRVSLIFKNENVVQNKLLKNLFLKKEK